MPAPIAQRSSRELFEEGRQAWPAVPLTAEDFQRFVEGRTQELAEGVAGDLYLACACARQTPQALAAFEQAFVGQVPAYLSRVEGAGPFLEDVRQLLRIRLFVPPAAGAPKIAEYRGKGPLGAWVRVVAINLALELKRASQPAVSTEEIERLPEMVAQPNPELDFIRVRYAEPFKKAFAAALSALEPRERTVLKMHLVHGLSIDKIAQLYQVHRSTAARWLVDVRERLYDETRGRLVDLLQLPPRELDSLLALVRSDIDVSVRRILGESKADISKDGKAGPTGSGR
ncbi:MAG: sigma-70 family RNA polymerase sigma factor [Myxococcales bacterium]